MDKVLLIALVLVVLTIVVHRWRHIHSGSGAFRCSLVTQLNGNRVRLRRGTARYGTDQLLWWGDWTLGIRPSTVWQRHELNVLKREPCPRGCSDMYVVTVEAAGRTQILEMSHESYAGFTSWLEATSLPSNWVV